MLVKDLLLKRKSSEEEEVELIDPLPDKLKRCVVSFKASLSSCLCLFNAMTKLELRN